MFPSIVSPTAAIVTEAAGDAEATAGDAAAVTAPSATEEGGQRQHDGRPGDRAECSHGVPHADQLSPAGLCPRVTTRCGSMWRCAIVSQAGPEQAVYFHRALSCFGVEHELVVYPRGGHNIAERQHQIDLLRRTRAWFARWLGADGRAANAFSGR